jgi:hypothetical protein
VAPIERTFIQLWVHDVNGDVALLQKQEFRYTTSKKKHHLKKQSESTTASHGYTTAGHSFLENTIMRALGKHSNESSFQNTETIWIF